MHAARLIALVLLMSPATRTLGQDCDASAEALTRPGAAEYDGLGYAVALGTHGLAVGAPEAEATGTVEFYTRSGSSWTHAQTITPNDSSSGDFFGIECDMDGDVMVVSSPFNGNGAAYVYRWDGSAWQHEQKITTDDYQQFGWDVAVQGDRLLLGAPFYAGESGAAYVFEFDGASWVETQRLEPSIGGRFGWPVVLAADIAVIGAIRDGAGAAYVYRHDGDSFIEEQKLVPSDGLDDDRAGVGLASDGLTVVLGANFHSNREGAAYVFTRDGASWVERQKLVEPDPRSGNIYGNWVSVNGGRLMVGSHDDDAGNASGSVYIYADAGGRWTLTEELHAPAAPESSWFGWRFDDDGTSICIGARTSDQFEESAGAAYTYRCGLDQDTDGDGLLDSWETEGGGIDVNADGVVDLDLYALGARHDSKDLFVEVDIMQDAPFLIESIEDVIDTFANAPVTNPDGTEGVRLHVDTGTIDVIESAEFWDDDFIAFDIAKDQFFGTESDRSSGNSASILAAKKRAFRYCIFADKMIDGSLGIAERPGNDFYVTLGSISPARVTERRPWRWWVAHVFMHELGHNLGLTHGGGFDADGDDPDDPTYVANYKPNYISCMNYAFDFFRWSNADGDLVPLDVDFSREALLPLDESNLSEPVGIPTDEYNGVFVPYGHAGDDGMRKIGWAVLDDPDGIDWNGDVDWDDIGVVEDVTFYGDQRPQHGTPTPGDSLNGFNDWAIINLAIGTEGDFADYTHATTDYDEISAEVLDWHADHVPPPPAGCRVDLNEDLVVDTRDVIRFLDLWADKRGAADFNLDGAIDTRDVIAFLNEWTAGCR